MLNLSFRFYHLKSIGISIPHPSKASFGGEDSFFISKNNKVIGIADGVGGWANVPGGNSAKYSRDLMKYSDELGYLMDPIQILENAYQKMDKALKGSTTAMILCLNDTKANILNVGDSGCSIFRNGKALFSTIPTVYGFNFPYQLGMNSKTLPRDGTYDSFPIELGDIIISGTDGVWDNIWQSSIEEEIKKTNLLNDKISHLGKEISNIVNRNSHDINFKSPFAVEARNHGYNYNGGKPDDITLIASIVVH